jgi:hypothetical protein
MEEVARRRALGGTGKLGGVRLEEWMGDGEWLGRKVGMGLVGREGSMAWSLGCDDECEVCHKWNAGWKC